MVYWYSKENDINWYYQEKDKPLKLIDLFRNRKPLFGIEYSKQQVMLYNILKIHCYIFNLILIF